MRMFPNLHLYISLFNDHNAFWGENVSLQVIMSISSNVIFFFLNHGQNFIQHENLGILLKHLYTGFYRYYTWQN